MKPCWRESRFTEPSFVARVVWDTILHKYMISWHLSAPIPCIKSLANCSCKLELTISGDWFPSVCVQKWYTKKLGDTRIVTNFYVLYFKYFTSLLLGSPFVNAIIHKGFDERHAYIGGMFGAGIYFAENSSKSNQYVYGIGGGTGCPIHKDRSCYVCHR